jgi:hypothetical protein
MRPGPFDFFLDAREKLILFGYLTNKVVSALRLRGAQGATPLSARKGFLDYNPHLRL